MSKRTCMQTNFECPALSSVLPFGHEFAMDEYTSEQNELNAGNDAESLNSPLETKHQGGRPKGSKNKIQPVSTEPAEPKCRGRPPGTGPKQMVQAMAGDNEILQKRPSKACTSEKGQCTAG
ncbi:hypothetical protein B0H10DRAFT_1964738 [Mycena sp. CBHHK59/15]|nr:hypothetical protein B0H10DRAFT_1964738 [Mycena sp. CBHHK59/15]